MTIFVNHIKSTSQKLLELASTVGMVNTVSTTEYPTMTSEVDHRLLRPRPLERNVLATAPKNAAATLVLSKQLVSV